MEENRNSYIKQLERDLDYQKSCLIAFCEGLEMQNIDTLIDKKSPDTFRELGKLMAKTIKNRLAEQIWSLDNFK